MNILYAISSHESYAKASSHLLKSMPLEALNDTMLVIGGWAADSEMPRERTVKHNSFDLTALISLVENPLEGYSHIFLLHDTMEFGPKTHELVYTANPDHYATAIWGGQCNLMLLRYDYALTHAREWILTQKNAPKQEAIHSEGVLFRSLPSHLRGSYSGDMIEMGVEYPYGDSPRMKEYYSGVDLVKYKANWGQTHPGNYVVTP